MSFPVRKQAMRARLYYLSTEFQTVSVSKVRTNQKEFSQGTSVKGFLPIHNSHPLSKCISRERMFPAAAPTCKCVHTQTCAARHVGLVQTSPL